MLIYNIVNYLTAVEQYCFYYQLFNLIEIRYSDDRHPYFKPGKPKEDEPEEDLNDANFDEVSC